MKTLWKKLLCQGLAVLLLFSLLAPAAQALTADQLKELLGEHYLYGVTDAVLDEDTIEAIMAEIDDPYTDYLDAEEYQALLASMEDTEVAGIGISGTMTEQGLLIAEVFPNTPAQRKGLVAGDIITAVDGQSTIGQEANTVTGWIQGEAHTQMRITVLHADGKERDYTITRLKIVIASTTSEILENGMGYINCKTFGTSTLGHFLDAMKKDMTGGAWIVDLRSNLGGDVYGVSQVLGVFIGMANVVYLRDGKDQYLLYRSSQDSVTIYPTIVLTSGYTASAAEIFASAIRDRGRGLIIGETTYGKGVAQVLLDQRQYPDYFSEGDALKVTAYRYFAAESHTTADRVGVIPHVLVPAQMGEGIAQLLSTEAPYGDCSGYLRIVLGNWRWYIDLEYALSEEMRPYFVALLEATAPGTVMRLGTEDGQWVYTNALELVAEFGLTEYQSRSFSDVGDSLYRMAINTLATYDILRGKGDGTFNPKGSLTRAELCAVLCQAMNLDSSGTSDYTDVPESAWYADEVQAVTNAGHMKGVGDGKFNPEGLVTQEQMITVMARLTVNLNTLIYEESKAWNDATDGVPEGYSDWSQAAVWLLAKSQVNLFGKPVNLLYDEPENIDPQGYALREETAAVLCRVLEYVWILPT